MVFQLRRILDPLIPDPPVSRLLYRICLGGLAGVVIAWFWSSAPTHPGELGAASFSSFSVAFLSGNSIDIFFQLFNKLTPPRSTNRAQRGGRVSVQIFGLTDRGYIPGNSGSQGI
ncbi:MAG: hypothetical protein EXR05_06965 [Acetobacteraceae bacterium]|nr:hypothetical protein [Acetobacteraceae bacterium]MSP30926.1 hypothetical protein [Acetobacteraceae bacterium]